MTELMIGSATVGGPRSTVGPVSAVFGGPSVFVRRQP